MERDSGRSKGFGFVVLNSQDDVKEACDEMNGYVSFRYFDNSAFDFVTFSRILQYSHIFAVYFSGMSR